MSSSVVLKSLGLNFSPNNLELPAGSMTSASDVIIKRADVAEPRRGYHLYGNSFGSSSDIAKQLFSYKTRLLRHYASTLQYDSDGDGTFLSFSGTFNEAQTGLRTKSIESNGNLYLTSSDGIKLISAANASQFTTAAISEFTSNIGQVVNAGVPKAIDFTAVPVAPAAGSFGFLPQDSTVAYKTTWATKDANNNLKIGSPSQGVAVYSPLLSLLIPNFMSTLEALNNIELSHTASFFASAYNYVNNLKVTDSATSVQVGTNLTALATQIDNDIIYANDNASGSVPLTIGPTGGAGTGTYALSATTVRITFSSGNPLTYFSPSDNTQYIYLAGFGVGGTSGKSINGAQAIVARSSTTLDFVLSGGGLTTNETFSIAGGGAGTTTIVSDRYRHITPPLTQDTPPTAAELASLQTYLQEIISQLQSEYSVVISSTNQTNYLTSLDITTSTNVLLTVQIPQDVTTNDFLQIYRSAIITAQGTDILNNLVPNSEETQLVYEAYPTNAELTAGKMIVTDVTPDIFKGANLYTNASTGEGILQANDIPPFALDINRFKNVIFYANTKTRHRMTPFSIIGVSNMVADALNGIIPTITIANTDGVSNTYKFVLGLNQSQSLSTTADTAGSLAGLYFLLYSANNSTQYYVWYKVSGVGSDPALSGKTGIQVNILTNATNDTVALATRDAIAAAGVTDFTTILQELFTITSGNATAGATYTNNGQTFTVLSTVASSTHVYMSGTGLPAASGTLTKTSGTGDATLTFSSHFSGLVINNNDAGFTTQASVGTSGFSTFQVFTAGQGESTTNNEILLSQNISPAIAVDETARSMVRVINANSNEVVYAYYTSTLGQVPGQMVLEARSLHDIPFYVLANDTNTGSSFFPNISPVTILSGAGVISIANPTVITSTAHGLVNNDQIIITGSNSTPSVNGIYTVTVTGVNTFTIPVNVTVAGTKASYSKLSVAPVSQNEVKPNRLYYSKLQQPEAVPILNYFEVGALDKAILRIFPLRDSLFILKEDGLFRLSGEVIGSFFLSLFDSSCINIAPDSVALANNLIYAYTRQGVSTISEAGVSTPPVSRPIDTEILKISSDSYTNFPTSTWGIGYESDNSYTVFTVQKNDDTHATIGYRYSNLTNTWTTVSKDSVCGIIHFTDDKMYLGAGDTNYIEQERKNFDRTDYADRELSSSINTGSYTAGSSIIVLPTVSGIAAGDVILQDQLLTVYKYNALLEKLDLDPGVAEVNISNITAVNTLLTITAANHNLTAGNYVSISGNLSVPSINGIYPITYVSSSQFKISIPSPLSSISTNTGLARFNYYNSLKAVGGNQLRTNLLALTAKLDIDPNLTYGHYSVAIASLSQAFTTPYVSIGDPAIITSTAHGLQTGRYVSIAASNSSPIVDGDWVITRTGANTFTIPTNVNTAATGAGGSFTTLDTSFQDLEGCFNIIINQLNLDSGTAFKNYKAITLDTSIETVITAVNPNTKQITIGTPLDFIVGPVTIYKAINSTIIYAPNTLGDPLGLKHMQEATVMFSNKAFTSATLSFSSDLLPMFIDVPFQGAGNGIFGNSGNFGDNYFGGLANSAPFRTYFPRDVQRCRYSVVKFNHQIARESFAIYGITLSGNIGQSTRAYR